MPPVATYRVQISPDFDLPATAGLAGYLADLGVTHLYASPLLQAAAGSAHGYDVVDHGRVDAGRGGEAGRLQLVAALRRHGLGMVVDIVPNHCGVAVPQENPAWWDVLRLGPDAPHASWFDVDWSRGHLVLPVLGDEPDPLGALRLAGGTLRYGELAFPVAPGTGGGTARQVHERQHYRLVAARDGDREVNYRRFFAVSTLAALRVEDPGVFEATHRLVLRWAADGECDGIRVDHPDGLADPTGYLGALRARTPPGTWLVVEKITETGEGLPAPWPCDGTTGYDALREVTAVFVDPAGEAAFTALDTDLRGVPADWPELVHESKHEVAATLLAAEFGRLARLAPEVPAPGAREALVEIACCFDVYRSYLPLGADRLEAALGQALRRRPDLAGAVGALRARLFDPADPLAARLQQTTGALTAKGVEDTAMYRWTRFVALNEVGGDPARFGRTPEQFHEACRRRLERMPEGMTTLSTHDTKRSEDVRARLAVLSEIPAEWAAAARRWTAGAPGIDGAFAHLLWQTAVGTWPIERERLHDYCAKAMREAGTHTSWRRPDPDYEKAVHAAVDRLFDDPVTRREVDGLAGRIRPYGWVNSLGQKLVALTMPGVPDVYQGSELWDNSLVDPDNRRPVDFAARRDLLARLDAAGTVPPVDGTGAAKLWLVSRTLRTLRDLRDLRDLRAPRGARDRDSRAERPEPPLSGYRGLRARGPAAGHALAFDRGGAITVATRLPVGLERRGGWGDTRLDLPDGGWTDVLSGRRHGGGVALADLLARLPAAFLVRSAPWPASAG